MTFGEKLKKLRNEAGLSFAQFAERTGLGPATLKDYEGGRRSPLLESAQIIAHALGVSCEVFDGCEFPHAKQKAATQGSGVASGASSPAEAEERPTAKAKGSKVKRKGKNA